MVTILAIIGALALLCSAALGITAMISAWRNRHNRHEKPIAQYHREQSERLQAQIAERTAARNGRPHSQAMTQRATRHD